MNRKILPEVQTLFNKYSSPSNTRRLPKDQAVEMLEKEFHIETKHAEEFYRHYKLDADGSDAFSLWEFQHFYNIVGESASDIVARFEVLDTERTGFLPLDKVQEAIKDMTKSGEITHNFTEKQTMFFIKTAAKGSDLIDIGQFSDLIARMKMYKKDTK